MFAILEQQANGRRSWVARNSLGGKSHTMWFQNDTPPIFYISKSNAERDAELFRTGNARQCRTTYIVVEVGKVDEGKLSINRKAMPRCAVRTCARSEIDAGETVTHATVFPQTHRGVVKMFTQSRTYDRRRSSVRTASAPVHPRQGDLAQ